MKNLDDLSSIYKIYLHELYRLSNNIKNNGEEVFEVTSIVNEPSESIIEHEVHSKLADILTKVSNIKKYYFPIK